MNNRADTRALISSLIEKLGTLDKLAQEMPGSRSGNGWIPSEIGETVVMVVPQSLDRLVGKAIKRSVLTRVGNALKPRDAASKIAGVATLIYFPIWYLKGYHECFYLRNAKYAIPADKDTVAVEVDGVTRDLMIEEKESKIVPEVLKRRLQRFSGLFTGQRRYFTLSDVIELAVKNRFAEMYVTHDGREGDLIEEVLEHNWKTQRIFDVAQLNLEGAATRIASSGETKESVIERFRQRHVKMPDMPRQVLRNTFQLEELSLFYLPYIHLPVLKSGRLSHVILNAASAKTPDGQTIELVERQIQLERD